MRRVVSAILMTVSLHGCVTTLEDVRQFPSTREGTFTGKAQLIARCTMERIQEHPLALKYAMQDLPDASVSISGVFHDLVPLFGDGVSFEALFVQREPNRVAITFKDNDVKRLGREARQQVWPLIEWCAKPSSVISATP